MKKITSSVFVILIVTVVLYFNFNSTNEHAENNLNSSEDEQIKSLQVASDKVFEIRFDPGVNESFLNSENLYVIDSNNNVIKTTIQKINDELVHVLPPKNGYEEGDVYRLYINGDLDLEKVRNEKMPDEYEIPFEIYNEV
ncbi:hypothetical protein BEP19_09740 [Ammoniphilus oxalaticus]|uniref:SbsA Ig-like domain-containing protein n=1 Tax=Ammoniphilus oxalaticus TaxID=66863 RepID=A0A419SL39_9BACL|nr:hypothetical protein [Ammoniphilus oxalaticus]RKD24646.1 hypothetical protein BEP19_09740 [Ammoniphilus oxalaticus]